MKLSMTSTMWKLWLGGTDAEASNSNEDGAHLEEGPKLLDGTSFIGRHSSRGHGGRAIVASAALLALATAGGAAVVVARRSSSTGGAPSVVVLPPRVPPQDEATDTDASYIRGDGQGRGLSPYVSYGDEVRFENQRRNKSLTGGRFGNNENVRTQYYFEDETFHWTILDGSGNVPSGCVKYGDEVRLRISRNSPNNYYYLTGGRGGSENNWERVHTKQTSTSYEQNVVNQGHYNWKIESVTSSRNGQCIASADQTFYLKNMGTTMASGEKRWLTGDRGSGNWYVYTKDLDAEWDLRKNYQWQIITALGNDGAEKRFWNQAWYSIELVKDAYKNSAANVKLEDNVGFDDTFYVYDNNIDTAVIATKGEAVFVAFRGTEDFEKIFQGIIPPDVTQLQDDGSYAVGNTNCKLHKGLAEGADNLLDKTSNGMKMKDRVVDLMTACGSGCKLVISGHSAGTPQALYMAGMDMFRGYDPIVMNFGGLPSVHKDHTTHCEAIIDPANIFNFVYQDNIFIDPIPFSDKTCHEDLVCKNVYDSDKFRNIGKYIFMERNSNDVQETTSTGSIKQKASEPFGAQAAAAKTHSSTDYRDKVNSLRDLDVVGSSGVRMHGYENGTPCGYGSLDFLCAGTCDYVGVTFYDGLIPILDYKCK